MVGLVKDAAQEFAERVAEKFSDEQFEKSDPWSSSGWVNKEDLAKLIADELRAGGWRQDGPKLSAEEKRAIEEALDKEGLVHGTLRVREEWPETRE
jgi:hypothetical protein